MRRDLDSPSLEGSATLAPDTPLLAPIETHVKEDFLFNYPTNGKSSIFGAFIILINTAIGSGTLMIPFCYTGGFMNAILISLLYMCVTVSCMNLNVETSFRTHTYDYKGLFELSFGKKLILLINILIFFVQFGSCMIYCYWNGIFLNNLLGINHKVFGNRIFWTFVLTAVTIVPLVCLKSLSSIAGFATFSGLCIILLIVHAIYYFVKDYMELGFDPNKQFALFKFNDVFISSLSVNSMAYNCIINLNPILENLHHCTLKRARSVNWITMGVSFLLYNIFGIFSYLDLFDEIKNTSSLVCYDPTNPFTIITIIGTMVVLTCSAPLVLWAARNVVNETFWGNEPPSTLRWVLVGVGLSALAAGLACASDNAVIFFNIVGGLFTPSVIFLFPALFFLINVRDAPTYKKLICYFICLMSGIATVACTYQAISDAINS